MLKDLPQFLKDLEFQILYIHSALAKCPVQLDGFLYPSDED